MSNEEYQHLLRVPTGELREALAGGYPERLGILQLLKQIDDEGVALALRDLGHDLGDLLEAFTEADQVTDRPSAIFAYTIKAWCLPTQDHPANHSALLTTDQWRALAVQLGADPDDPWAPFPPDSSKGAVCVAAAERLRRIETGPDRIVKVPEDLGLSHHVKESTQQALGRFLLDVSREDPELSARIVTVSPDVASSTNRGGWINRVGIWNIDERIDWFENDRERLLHWKESGSGQHIELGIAEVNLVGILSELD